MRAVVKLERRFKGALENLNLGADEAVDNQENTKLLEQISALETAQSEKDAQIEKLQANVAAKEELVTASVNQAELSKSAMGAVQKENADLVASVKEEKDAKQSALVQVDELQVKLNALEAEKADTKGGSENVAELETEIASLNARLEEAEVNSQDYFNRMRRLRGRLREVRTNMKEDNLTPENVNHAMEAELEGLLAQRELDLNEINIVLEKLTPLVEGK